MDMDARGQCDLYGIIVVPSAITSYLAAWSVRSVMCTCIFHLPWRILAFDLSLFIAGTGSRLSS